MRVRCGYSRAVAVLPCSSNVILAPGTTDAVLVAMSYLTSKAGLGIEMLINAAPGNVYKQCLVQCPACPLKNGSLRV
jgi:molybdopterin biosynthesis enzyme MoaB